MNKFKLPSILMIMLVSLFIISEIFYMILGVSYDLFHTIRFLIFIFTAAFIVFHAISKIKYYHQEKDLIVWKIDLLEASIDSLVDNFTILDLDLKIVYTNYRIIDKMISKDRLKMLKSHKMSEVFDNIENIHLIEKKLKEVMAQKKECRFITEINGEKLIVFACPIYKQDEDVAGLVVLAANYIEKDSIIKI